MATYSVGSLVRVRERDWVVLPSGNREVLRLRPITGGEEEACSIFLPLEGDGVAPSEFPMPDPQQSSDFTSGRILRDAVRLSLRSGAIPFRCLGRLSVTPRPYQYVPLIMAMRMNPVRLLIADDVGVGKTVEAGLVASELLARGSATRLCVLCPPHLTEQWQRELREKFNLDARILRAGTVGRLERDLPRRTMSLYEYYKVLVASIDYVKSERHKHDFLAHCPDLVIVDEAHLCSRPAGARGETDQQQRYELVSQISADAGRHLILLTATPHSGIESSFASILGFLNRSFDRTNLDDMSAREREKLSRHFIQRRRRDVERWLGTPTPFPVRESLERTYNLSLEQRALLDGVIEFTRQRVRDPVARREHQRVKYWAAVTLVRCVMSSPGAAVQALSQQRMKSLREEDSSGVDEAVMESYRRREVMDPVVEEGVSDSIPQGTIGDALSDLGDRGERALRRLEDQARRILESGPDPKLDAAISAVRSLLEEGYHPIVYCRFIPTAHYVSERLNRALSSEFPGFRSVSVTGEMDDEQREAMVHDLAKSPYRVLVATDCLSEGVNLQEDYDAVVHYDLPWNPNRLEQREGRVDRYGQKKDKVKAVLLYGRDNPVDGAVLRVLLTKARQIRDALGISVPVPVDSESVMEAVISAILAQDRPAAQLELDFGELTTFHLAWDRAAEREKMSRTRFAQYSIKPEEVARELEAVDSVLGDQQAVNEFVLSACQRLGVEATVKGREIVIDRDRLWEALGGLSPRDTLPSKIALDSPPRGDAVLVGRNHPLVTGLSQMVVGCAFQPIGSWKFARCGASYCAHVRARTVLLLLRMRYRLVLVGGEDQFAEEVVSSGFASQAGVLRWLAHDGEEVRTLLEQRTTSGTMAPEERVRQVKWAIEVLKSEEAQAAIDGLAKSRASNLSESYRRLEQYVGSGRVSVEPYRPDVLGVYVFVPGGEVR